MVRLRCTAIAAIAALTLVAAACGSDSPADTEGATTGPANTSVSTTMPTPSDSSETTPSLTAKPLPGASTPSGSVEPGLQPAVDIAVADVATRTGVDPSAITVVSARNVTWPDGSNGCPQPGMNYIQVQVDGAEIILAANGATYRYTLGGGQGPKLCTNG